MGCSTDLFQNFKQLRALILKNLVELLDTMDNLIHLRYLNVVDCYGKLPVTCAIYKFIIFEDYLA